MKEAVGRKAGGFFAFELDHFHSGRVALTGDAAWAVMGYGTTLALIGP